MSHDHPPKAMVTRTSTIPKTLIVIPIRKRLRPAYFPKRQPQKNIIRIAIAFDMRSAVCTSSMNINGAATGKVESKTRKKNSDCYFIILPYLFPGNFGLR